VNFHAAFRETFSTQVAVCKNHKGEIIKILTLVRPPCSQVNGEAQATKLASVFASSLQLDEFILEGESSIVVLALQNPAFRLDFHFEHVINNTLSSFPVPSFWKGRKINRNENLCDHYVAYRTAARVLLGCIPSLSSP
jgi:hypothetical protein